MIWGVLIGVWLGLWLAIACAGTVRWWASPLVAAAIIAFLPLLIAQAVVSRKA